MFLSSLNSNLMSAQSIPIGNPDTFAKQPFYVPAPISGVIHVPFTQLINSGTYTTNNQIYAAQCLAPFIANYANANTGTFILPDALTLSQVYGNANISTTISSQVPGFTYVPSTTVQVGDVFGIPIEVLSTSATGFTWLPGTGGTGIHTTVPYSNANSRDQLTIQFTAVGPTLATCSYTLQ